MSLTNHELMYDFQAKGLAQSEAIKQYADHAVKEIKSISSWDTDIQIHIEPEAKDKRLFLVSMSVYGLGEPIILKKEGKNVMAVMRKVRKGILRQVYRLNKKKICHRSKTFFKRQFA